MSEAHPGAAAAFDCLVIRISLCSCRLLAYRWPAKTSGGPEMTYVVAESCIKCKSMDCVEVCPVDRFYEGADMLVIHPDECIDCGRCAPECPAEAIKPDSEPGLKKWLKFNRTYSKTWPNITIKDEYPAFMPWIIGRRKA
jgi:ferredoxin